MQQFPSRVTPESAISTPPAHPSPRPAPQTSAERMRRLRHRHRLSGLHSVTFWKPLGEEHIGPGAPFGQQQAHIHHLLFHVAVAGVMLTSIKPLVHARRRLMEPGPRTHHPDWKRVLCLPNADIIAVLLGSDRYAAELRARSPFNGALSTIQQRRVHRLSPMFDAYRRFRVSLGSDTQE